MNDNFTTNAQKDETQCTKPATPFDKYVTCWVYVPHADVSISLPDLMVYSSMAYSQKYGKYPNNGQLAWKTGIHRNTIPNCIKRLQEIGLVTDRTPNAKADWFRKAGTDQFMFWKCLVRTQESPLSFSTSAVFSYLWHRVTSDWQPPHGWTAAYLASCLRLTNKTVNDSIDTLKKQQLLLVEDDEWLMPDRLTGFQVDYFRKKETTEVKQGGNNLRLFTPKMDVEQPKQLGYVEVDDWLEAQLRQLHSDSLSVNCHVSSEVVKRLRKEETTEWKDRAIELYKEIIEEQLGETDFPVSMSKLGKFKFESAADQPSKSLVS
jgi:hypothetical protein